MRTKLKGKCFPMNSKEVTCAVCGAISTKAQTILHDYKDKRARRRCKDTSKCQKPTE